jgi:hypothetical protein
MTYGTHLSSSSLLLSTNSDIRWSYGTGPPLGGQAPSEERSSDRAAALVHRRRERDAIGRERSRRSTLEPEEPAASGSEPPSRKRAGEEAAGEEPPGRKPAI